MTAANAAQTSARGYVALYAGPWYWLLIARRAEELGSDGCSGPARLTQAYRFACEEHDVHYRTHRTLDGIEIPRAWADEVLRLRIQQASWLGRFSPMAAWRAAALSLFGQAAWDGPGGSPLARDCAGPPVTPTPEETP